MKVRIVKMPRYTTLWELQRERWYGWEQLMWGTIGDCRSALDNLKKHGTISPVAHEEII